MAMMAMAFMSALGTAGAAAGGAAATVASAAGAMGAMSTVATVLSGVATAGSILSELAGGKEERREAYMSAELARLDGDREVTASEERANAIRREALQKIGAARVAFAGSGLDISSAGAIEDEIGSQAGYGLEMEKHNRNIARAEAGLRGRQLELRGDNARAASRIKAVTTGAQGLLSVVKRG